MQSLGKLQRHSAQLYGQTVGAPRRLVAALAATAFAASLAGCSTSSGSAQGSAPQVPKASASTLASQDASRLHRALTDKKPATVAAVLAPAVKAAYLKNPRQLLAAGSKLDIDSGKMMVSGDTATVPAKVTGGADAGSYLLVLEKQGDRWLLIGTEKQ